MLYRIGTNAKRLISWMIVASLIGAAAMVLYSASLFQELEEMMAQNIRSQPSIIYSDLYILRTGDDYANSFLTERLRNRGIKFEESDGEIQWQNGNFEYPAFLLPADSPLRTPPDARVTVKVSDGRVESVILNGEEAPAVVLEPTPVSQIAGSSHEIRNYVKLENIPTKLLHAIISIEDQRFLEHHGFDIRSLARAAWINIRYRALSQGGSTITQQLVKNLTGSYEKTIFRKARELVLAILMEFRYSKDTILEKYLNEIYIGQIGALEIHGVAEAAKYFFGKTLDELTLAEMALICGIIRGPAYYSPYRHPQRSLERKDTVLKKMAELRLITEVELHEALKQKLRFARPSSVNNRAPYFSDYVKSQVLDQLRDRISVEDLSAKGLRIYTSLDLVLQKRAVESVGANVRNLEARHKIKPPLRIEGLLVAAEPNTGLVRALVGGRSYGETTFNRVLNMKRQVGSTFKPLVYLAALLKGSDAMGQRYTGAYMVDDEPWTHEYSGQKWSPKNYEKGYRGRITLREAFINSVNIPAARIGVDVGLEQVMSVAEKLGIREPLQPLPSLALGAIEINAMEMLQAYSTLANRGERVELTTVRGIVDSNGRILARFAPNVERTVEPPFVDLINDMLRDVVRSGTAKSLAAMGYKKPAYGKTGTTSFYRDAWFAGFSQGLTVVTWAGFDELGLPVDEEERKAGKFKVPATLTGAGSALPAWASFMASAKPSPFEMPDPTIDDTLERHSIDRTTGQLSTSRCPAEFVYEEMFLPDTEPEQDCTVH